MPGQKRQPTHTPTHIWFFLSIFSLAMFMNVYCSTYAYERHARRRDPQTEMCRWQSCRCMQHTWKCFINAKSLYYRNRKAHTHTQTLIEVFIAGNRTSVHRWTGEKSLNDKCASHAPMCQYGQAALFCERNENDTYNVFGRHASKLSSVHLAHFVRPCLCAQITIEHFSLL